MKKLSEKQKQILEYISESTAQRSYPPSVREICEAVGLRSPSTVHAHIKALKEAGYISKDERKTRAISLHNSTFTRVPVLGRVTAGMPILAVEEVEGYVFCDLGHSSGEHFALTVQGDSMINAGIYDGDVVVVRKQPTADNNDIVVALIGDEATVKRLRRERGEIWLMPENDAYEPINGAEASVLGRVVALTRSIG